MAAWVTMRQPARYRILTVFTYFIQHCFICRPSDSTVSENAGIKPRTVATSALAVRRSSHSATSSPLGYISSPLGYISSPLGYISSPLGYISSPLRYISSPLGYISSPLGYISSPLGYIPSPLGYISSPLGYISSPLGYISSSLSHITSLSATSPMATSLKYRMLHYINTAIHLSKETILFRNIYSYELLCW
jgi:hypothetical protein